MAQAFQSPAPSTSSNPQSTAAQQPSMPDWNVIGLDPEALRIDQQQIMAELEQLSQFSSTESPQGELPAITRVIFSPSDMGARLYIDALASEAGLYVREDGVGNLFARWPGRDPNAPAVATGSHIDAVPLSGRFDGTVGVLGAIEAVRALKRAGFTPQRSIEIILFTAEEPTRFGLGCLGSRALTGTLDAQALRALHDEQGIGFDRARTEAGYDAPLDEVAQPTGIYDAFIELHIEQGPNLEALGEPIGVVTAIAAPAALDVQLDGEGGHAGTVLMTQRHDALLAGAEIALAVEQAALASGREDTVATVGLFQVQPGASNSIPSRVDLSIDIRDTDLAERDAVVERVQSAIDKVATERDVAAQVEVINADAPVQCDPRLIAACEASARALGLSSTRLVSRAYHDTLFMAQLAPSTMIFVPSKGGYSHRPEEYTSPEEIADGVRVLACTLAQLANAVD